MIPSQPNLRRHAFTLVELLVVIAIIGVLAGFTLVVSKSVGKSRKISVAKGELAQVQTALENYKAKYGTYPPSNPKTYTQPVFGSMMSQLYYELSGTTKTATEFVTLDGSSHILIGSVTTAYGAGGFINCTKGGGEDSAAAQNFLLGLTSKQINDRVTNNTIRTTMLITSVGGPDETYQPLGASGLNPIRYIYPGVNNPGGYDLWVQLVINSQTNLVCNWSKSVQINTSFP